MSPEIIGWAASAVLIATLVKQIHKQWTDENGQGVSHWLFIGQIAASVGFIAYSVLVKNWVFIVTNSLILVTAVVGQLVVWRRDRRARTSN